ncbi:MED14-domain-containing protein [Pyrenochaeta sp. DS3sAY3a]|nr:MED14-domain-containing protein [Pyrenochaeta sp. DS3sAY3a]
MNNSGSDAATAAREGDNRKRDYEGKLVNGNGASLAVSKPSESAMDLYSNLPPEIAEVPADAYNPISTLLVRMAQECYNDLTEVLDKMSDIPIAQQTNGSLPNGVSPHNAPNAPDNAKASSQKKLLLMKFAQDNRAKFIKLMVLTDWGKRSAADVAKFIDLYAWTREQSIHMEAADFAIDSVKRHASIVGEKNPDITTALEILSTGKASWMPSLDFIPRDPVSSEHALKLLRYMNASLSIRLNVHETLPRHLRNWRIQSGRATFVVDNQLEFDVMSFVEDTSQQWFFIDLRLLFSPAPAITVGSRFLMHLKEQADFTLRDKGLTGLFDFLNNFVLTHKITVLRSQALDLVRSGWAGSLKVEPVHRELVVSYWTDRPGKKNWIEIGVTTNKPKNGKVSWRGPPIPSLTARWFRQGKEVKDANLQFDWKDLSMERIIKQVIARHTGEILRLTKESLNPSMTVHANLSNTEPVACALSTTLGTKSNSITLSLEPVTGKYIMQPATALSARAEHALNLGREPSQIANILTQMLAQSLLSTVQRSAQQLGWQPVVRQSLNLQIIKEAVKLDALQFALYWPRGWSSTWAFATVIDSSGESWWVFEIGSNGVIDYAEQIKLDRPDGSSLVIDRKSLASLERVAVQLLSFRVTARQLEKEKKPCVLRYEIGETGASVTTQRIARRWVLYLRTIDVLTTKSGDQPWLESNIAVTCEGLRSEGRSVWHMASGRMVKSVAADMHKLMAASPQSNFSFSEDGRFRILLSTPFGEDILSELRARLRDVNRLRTFARTLQKRQMRLGSSSLQRVQFAYGPSPSIAAVNFSSEKEITLELSHNNPHSRVHRMLTEIANDRASFVTSTDPGDVNGLDRFCTILILTRSLLKALREVETRTPGNVRNPAVHAHTIFKYRITYENPICTFDVRLQPKDDHLYWSIEDCLKTRAPDARPTSERDKDHRRIDVLVVKLKEFFSTRGPGWFGTRQGIIAELDGVPDALKKLDEVVLSCKMEGGYKAPPPLEKSQAQQTQAQQQQQQQQQLAGAQGLPNGVQQQHQQQATMQARLQQQQQQARLHQQQQQQAQQQQAQNKGQQRKQPPQQMQRNQQANNARQMGQMGRGNAGGRPGGQGPGGGKQDVIEID